MRARGFTLAETVMTIFLFGLLLGLAGQAMSQYSRVHQRLQGRGQDAANAGLLLSTMRLEVEQAMAVTTAGPGQLVLSVLDPDVDLLPNPLPIPAPNAWPPAHLVTIRYALQGDTLMRDTVPVGRPYADFTCRQVASQEFLLRLTFNSEGRSVSRQCRVFRSLP